MNEGKRCKLIAPTMSLDCVGATGTIIKDVDFDDTYLVQFDAPVWHNLWVKKEAVQIVNKEAEAVEKAKQSIREHTLKVIDNLRYAQEQIRTAKTINDLMNVKRLLFINMLDLPIGSQSCPFCVVTDYTCSVCEYGKTHGLCKTDEGKYATLRSILCVVRNDAEEYWNEEQC